jgi:hypothetical protein
MKLPPHDLGPVRQETAPLRRRISSALRHAIEVGPLPSGSRLVEMESCAKLSVAEIADLVEALKQRNAWCASGRGESHQCRGGGATLGRFYH